MGAFVPPANTVTRMDAVHDSIVAALKAHFGDKVAQVGAYEPWYADGESGDDTLLTPALLLEIESIDITNDVDPDPLGRLPVTCALSVHCVLSVNTARLQQTLAQLAAVVASLVIPPLSGDQRQRGNTWGLSAACEAPPRVSAQPAGFSPGLNGRDSWAVRWDQVFYLNQEMPA